MQPAAAPTVEPTDPAAAAALRTALIGDRVTIEQAAVALGVTQRSVYNAITRKRIPFVRIFGVRYMAPADIRAALIGDVNRQPRRPGRPRKAA
jgi:excisionase family DNA binding protein